MNRSFEPNDEVELLPAGRADEGVTDGAGLGLGLSQITSRLLQQLATSDERIANGGVADHRNIQRDRLGSRVPWDGSARISWKRVVAVSAAGRMLALVSLPVHSGAR